MTQPHPSDGRNFTDLSGVTAVSKSSNPYDAILEVTSNDPTQISNLYATHRNTRNSQQRDKLLAPDFAFTPDPILALLLENEEEVEEEKGITGKTAYEDPRHCLVFWARPSEVVKDIIADIQARVREQFPFEIAMWLMPLENLHLTVLEIAHSLTAPEIDALVHTVSPKVDEIVRFPRTHQAVLIKPLLSFDAAALALSFVPASADLGEEARYSYHHLRRDVYALAGTTGVEIKSRYVVPSAHLTVGRWVDQKVRDEGRVSELVKLVDDINGELRGKYWGGAAGRGAILRWKVGEDKGLVCRRGTVWYGGGHSLVEG